MRMKLSQGCITFFGLRDFNEFIRELNLMGRLELLRPIVDNAGKILFAEDQPVKQGALDKLIELEGQYQQQFAAKITDEVIREIAQLVAKRAVRSLEFPDGVVVRQLFEGTRHNYRSYILNAFGSKKLIMVLYKMSHEKPDLFDYLAGFGLLCLGIVLPLSTHVRMIHRYSFLAGICADIGLMDTDYWKAPLEKYSMQVKAAERSARYVEGMSLPAVVPAAIRKHVLNPLDPPPVEEEDLDSLPGDLIDEEREVGGDDLLPLQKSGGDANLSDAELSEVLKEVLKIARFYYHVRHRCREKENYLKELIEKMAYNAARGFFSRKLVEPIIRRFRDYERSARFMMHIAEIERRCLRPPSAWAYPKPKATQILCRNREFDCPNILTGRDIHVMSDSEAFGWVGLNMEAGKYPKCTLEAELMKLSKEILK
ncbi:MAG: hypothetical protein JXA20_13095 [Spirochaetes bacterium]|nr:hypothetical protein [Spirochaetota bacterium]